MADQARARLFAAGLPERLETEVFDEELELRGTDMRNFLLRLDTYHLEITGAPPDLQTHLLAAILLEEAGAFRLTSVEVGYNLSVKLPRGQSLDLVRQAFPMVDPGGEPMLDRRLSMTWEWGTATTGYSLWACDTEDRDLQLGFKAREGYMALPELQAGAWMAAQAQRFDALVERFFTQLGWTP